MVYKSLSVKTINQARFKRFGWIIEYPKRSASRTRNLFKIIVRQPKGGWRIAYLIVKDKTTSRMEQHPDSLESFEPVKGKGLLYVSTRRDPDSIECFLLEKPVILKKGIWHGIVTLGRECEVKIVENAKVRCVYWPLAFKLEA